MPLFAHPTGTPSVAAQNAAQDLQSWLDMLGVEESLLLAQELGTAPEAGERPMVMRANAVIDRLKYLHDANTGTPAWGLTVKSGL